MDAALMIVATLAMGGLFVFFPMARRYRDKKVVKCPETDQPAEILVDASPTSSSGSKKITLTIRNCSLWPKRKGCTQGCIDHIRQKGH